MITAKNVTEAQLRSLRESAGQAGDMIMVVICDIALDGSVDRDDYTVPQAGEDRIMLGDHHGRRVWDLDQSEALDLCVEVINDAAGRSSEVSQ